MSREGILAIEVSQVNDITGFDSEFRFILRRSCINFSGEDSRIRSCLCSLQPNRISVIDYDIH